MKIPAIYAIFVGLMMFAQWIFFITAGQVPELQTEPYRIAFHLAAEFLTAAGLIVSGIALLKGAAWGGKACLVFMGMLTYTVIISPGYFAQQAQWALVGMFAILLVLALGSMLVLLRKV